MRELWYRVGIVVFILAALVLKTAPVLGNYTNAGAGFSVVGTRIGWEENYAGDFGTTVYYLPGFAYNNPSRSDDTSYSNVLHFKLESPKELNGAPLRNYTIYLWYSYRKNSRTTPLYNTLQLVDKYPPKDTETGRVYSYSISHTVSSQVSVGTEELKLEGGRTISISYGFSVPAKIHVGMDDRPYQQVYTATDINQLQGKLVKSKKHVDTSGSNVIFLASDNNWKLRYLGKITVTPYTDKVPTYMELAAILGSNNWAANYADNMLEDGVYIVATAVASYYKTTTHWGWAWTPIPHPYRYTVVHKPANIITFILGDNDEKIGDDCYMWFYRADN